MFKIAVCNNELSEIHKICDSINKWIISKRYTNVKVKTYTSSAELLNNIEKDISLYILDVNMNDIDGIELGARIRQINKNVSIAYVTDNTELALDAYELHALRYITKPYAEEEIFSTLNYVYSIHRLEKKEYILVKHSTTYHKIWLKDILYVENKGNSMFFVLSDNQRLRIDHRHTVFEKAAESVLLTEYFIQPHKSFIVNMNHIDKINKRQMEIHNGTVISISRNRVDEVIAEYKAFVTEELECVSSF